MFSSKNRVKFSKIQILQKTFSFFWGGGEGADTTMSLNFCENNIGFYTGSLKICKNTLRMGHRTDLMQLTHYYYVIMTS